jgi:hypothetical protein
MSTSTVTKLAVLLAGEAVQLAPPRSTRLSLALRNTGHSAVTLGIGGAPGADAGITLDPASPAGGDGGSYQVDGDKTPVDSIWAVSSGDTTVVVVEGVPEPGIRLTAPLGCISGSLGRTSYVVGSDGTFVVAKEIAPLLLAQGGGGFTLAPNQPAAADAA